MIRILIVDDSAIFREGLRAMLEAHTDWEVCGEAMNGVEGVQKNRLLKPHLIIMDLSMPQMSGIEAAAEILKEFPKVPILLLTLYLTPQLTQEARKVGIRATLSKTATNHLVGGIDAVLRDGCMGSRLGIVPAFRPQSSTSCSLIPTPLAFLCYKGFARTKPALCLFRGIKSRLDERIQLNAPPAKSDPNRCVPVATLERLDPAQR